MTTFIKNTLTVLAICFLASCGSKQKDDTSSYTITKVQSEKDGQTLFLMDLNGKVFTTIISIPNGNYVKVSEGDKITLDIKEIIDMTPPAIVSKNIRIVSQD